MRKIISFLILLTIFFYGTSVFAQNRVIVIPLGSKTFEDYWQGDWQEGVSYVAGNGVQYDGSSYVCKADHESANLNAPPDNTHWDLTLQRYL